MCGKQLGLTDCALTTAKKCTKREKILAEYKAVVPLQALLDLIEHHYPKTSKKGGSSMRYTTSKLEGIPCCSWLKRRLPFSRCPNCNYKD